MILAVFFARLFERKHTGDKKQISPQQERKSKIYPELILICLTALLGNVLGNVKLSFLTLSFGSTACTLMVGVLVGYIFFKTSKSGFISAQCLNAFKNLGLALFFVGTGFLTGSQNVAFEIKSISYGILITLTAIICGWGVCKLIERKNPLPQGGVIAGGMTSSPAYGVLSDTAIEVSVNCFSFSYFGALISLMISLSFIT